MPPKKPKKTVNTLVLQESEEVQADEASKGLLREFMHSKGLERTLETFNKEQPKGELTVSSRTVMVDLLQLHQSKERNRQKEKPRNTLLEVICDDRLIRREEAATADYDSDDQVSLAAHLQRLEEANEQLASSVARSFAQLEQARQLRQQRFAEMQQLREDLAAGAATEKPKGKKGNPKDAKKEKKEKKKKKKKTVSIDELLSRGTPRPSAAHEEDQGGRTMKVPHAEEEVQRVEKVEEFALNTNHGSDNEKDGDNTSHSSGEESFSAQAAKAQAAYEQEATAQIGSKGWGGIDTYDGDTASTNGSDPLLMGMGSAHTVQGRPIDMSSAQNLKTLIFGTSAPPECWLQQGFFYSDGVDYGLVQNVGGPCGLLAAVQARVIKYLFFDSPSSSATTQQRQHQALVAALAETLLTVADGSAVQLLLPPEAADVEAGRSSGLAFKVDFELWRQRSLGRDRAAVVRFFEQSFAFFAQPRGLGMLAFLTSVIWTRGGVDAVKADMDTESPLVVRFQYTSQELVSLLLFGKAHSNVFDGTRTHGSMMLRGVPSPSDIGLLANPVMSEQLGLGDFLKTPRYPIWIVWNESHYCVTFSKTQLDLKNAREAEIFFYDQQWNGEDYRLTIDATGDQPIEDDDDMPYMDRIIRVRGLWATAKVDWNGSDPLY